MVASQVQKWYKRSNKGSIPMLLITSPFKKSLQIPSNDPFKNTIDQIKKRGDNMLLSVVDTQYLKSTQRNLSAMQNKIIEAHGNEKSVTNHLNINMG